MTHTGDNAEGGGRAGSFRLVDWNVDPATCRIQRGGDVVKLEPKVMGVLVYLADRPGQVVTRQALEDALWAGTVVGYDAVTGSILKLRKAFDDNPKHPRIIQTIPKKGYRLVATPRASASSPERAQATDAGTVPGKAKPRFVFRMVAAAAVIGAVALVGTLLTLWGQPREVARGPAADPSSPASIAVLPFDNLSEDPGQGYFVDGMTDDLITELARISGALVIARDSTFAYRGQPVDVRAVARALNVRYVLHGSVRRAPDGVRVNARLVDTDTGNLVWAERYEGTTGNIFALQDEIAQAIVSALALKLTAAERQYLARPETADLQAYEYFLHGSERFFRYARASNQEARRSFEQSIERDPGFAKAYAMLAWTHTFDFMNGWSETPDRSLALGEQFATRALSLDDALPVAYFVRGLVFRERGEYIKALVEAEEATALDPSYANGHVLHATLLYYAGRPREGLEKMQKAIQLNPHHPFNYPFHLGQAYFVLERYDEAIEAFERGLATNPASERLRVWLAAAYARSGQVDEAQWQLEQIQLANPDISLERQAAAFPFQDPADLKRFLDGLRQAGLSS